jgi:hypothetical protein
MQPAKEQFKEFTQFTDNVDDRILNFQIKQSYSKNLVPKFGDLITTIYNSEAENADELAESKPELAAFYTDYMLEYWILSAYRRFFSQHGINVTQFGLTRTADPEGTFTPANGDDRAIIMRQVSSDINVLETSLYRRLCEVNWTFDGVTFNNPDTESRKQTPKKNFGIRPIPDCDDDLYKKENPIKYIQ